MKRDIPAYSFGFMTQWYRFLTYTQNLKKSNSHFFLFFSSIINSHNNSNKYFSHSRIFIIIITQFNIKENFVISQF